MTDRPSGPPEAVTIALRSVDRAADRTSLARWLIEEHVRRWWGDPALNLADFDDHLAAQHAIVAAGEESIGYVRWRHLRGEDLSETGVPTIPGGAVDIDLFIGDPAWLGRGAGPAALSLLLTTLRADPTVSIASVSTSVQNARAIRAYEKAGFRRYRQYDDTESGPCWIMTAQLGLSAPSSDDTFVGLG